ncbi:carbohydrate ABC transporter permease [Rhizohabitans arisaemae]|uniref:carbohydrate ABC transporter permease n=1 Tax=Rhizohabitans arisaemae TaxID=2720610 RepID=UPI0024B284D8|nr:carbohydrate ABC transporter permease [Rhizohabitans arisaemae]
MNRRTAARIGRYLLSFALVVVAVAAIYPLLFTVISSLKSQTGFAHDPLGLPTAITFENYLEAFRRLDMPRLLMNSLVTTAGGLIISVLAALLAAYAVTKLRIPGGKLVFLLVIITLTIPGQAIIYPLYQTVLDLGMSGEYQGLILVYAAFGLPLGTYQLAGYFQQIPDELIEAARVDGAGHFTILFRLLTPIATPAIAALAIFNFVWMWNDLILPLVIMGGSDSKTLMVGVSLLTGQYDLSVPLVSAGLIIALLPVLIIYLVFQRQLVAGALAGSGK